MLELKISRKLKKNYAHFFPPCTQSQHKANKSSHMVVQTALKFVVLFQNGKVLKIPPKLYCPG